MEMRSISQAQGALKELAKLLPNTAARVVGEMVPGLALVTRAVEFDTSLELRLKLIELAMTVCSMNGSRRVCCEMLFFEPVGSAPIISVHPRDPIGFGGRLQKIVRLPIRGKCMWPGDHSHAQQTRPRQFIETGDAGETKSGTG